MVRAKSGLGRGLAALIPTGHEGVQQVDIDLIAPNPQQPRSQIDSESLASLSQSLSEHGFLQPLLVTRNGGESGAASYTLIAGERRLQAARLAGLVRVPVLVREATDIERLELALVENLQREDLNPLEEAQAYRRLIDGFGLTQEMAAQRVGRSRVAVANAVRLLTLEEPVRARLAAGEISAGHARALLGAEEPQRQRILDQILEQGLNVRQTEALVRAMHEPVASPTKPPPATVLDPEKEALEERLRSALATQVRLLPGRKGGRIVIHYYGDEDLQELLAVLMRGRGT